MNELNSSTSIPSVVDHKPYILGSKDECCPNESPKAEIPKIKVKREPVHIFSLHLNGFFKIKILSTHSIFRIVICEAAKVPKNDSHSVNINT